MADKHYQTTDQYTLSFSDSFVKLHFTWNDKSKQLLSDFLSDYTVTFCELYAAIRKPVMVRLKLREGVAFGPKYATTARTP